MESDQQQRKCEVCESIEGELRPIGNYEVILKWAVLNGKEMLTCQSCRNKMRQMITTNSKTDSKMIFNQILRKVGIRIFSVILFVTAFSVMVQAQGLPGLPTFPNEPAEAPIDGGLSLLAAAGGAYAIKKLKEKKVE